MYGKDNTTTTSMTFAPPVDNNNGTVYVASQNLTWAKCSQFDAIGGNMYKLAANDCSLNTAVSLDYCAGVTDCDNGSILTGAGASGSGVWSTCNSMNGPYGLTGRTTWRAPNIGELTAFYSVYAANLSLFPSTVAGNYWSSSAYDATNALYVSFTNGSVTFYNKTNFASVRCVSSGP